MSDELFTNIEDLDALVQQCEVAGERILQNSETFQGDVQQAVGEFRETMNSLRTEVQEFHTEMTGDITTLKQRADGVRWEGNARRGFDGDVAAFQTAMKNACDALHTAIDANASAVNNKFSASLDEAALSNQQASQSINESMTQMRTETANTRSGVEATDASWTSAL